MPNLNLYISFKARFLFTGAPSLQLTVDTTLTLLEQQNFNGYYSITQPDGITVTGVAGDVVWNGSALNVITKTLRLATDQLFQRGTYSVTLFGTHPGYTAGSFSRTFIFNYNPVTQAIKEDLDVFTPRLRYIDETVYLKTGYNILSQTAVWTATSPAGAITPGTGTTFNLSITGQYYDSTYVVNYVKTVVYEDVINAWLSISQGFSYAKSSKSYLPQSMNTLLTYLDKLKSSISGCLPDSSAYMKANALYQHIRNKVCNHSTLGLKGLFDEFYRLTHNYQDYGYSNTGGVIPAYDFTTGCAGSSAGQNTYVSYYTAAIENETVITSSLPSGARVIGLRKGINPLLPAQFDITALPVITLIGVALGSGETLFIDYAV